MKKKVTVKDATWIWRLFFRIWAALCDRDNVRSFATLWGSVIVLPCERDNLSRLAFELTRLEQIARLGRLQFIISYAIETFWMGRRFNPYEVEAREAALNPWPVIDRFKITRL